MEQIPTDVSPERQAATTSPPPTLADSSKRLLPWLIAVAFFMESLDTTILNTAVPTIAAALNVAPLSMKSVLASYTLSLAVFIPISGWMADKYGTRRVFASAIGIFSLGSFLCGISTSIHVLVACRILQGCGGSMMVPVGRLTVVRTFAKSELIRAMSFVAIPALIGPMLGPIAGGLIVGYFHWRLIFFVNIPIGLVGSVDGQAALAGLSRADEPPGLDRVDPFWFRRRLAFVRAGSVWRTHDEHAGNPGPSGAFDSSSRGLRNSCVAVALPDAESESFPASHVSRGGRGQLYYPAGDWRHPVSVSASVSGRFGLHADSVWSADDAAGDRVDEPESGHARNSEAIRLPYRGVLVSNTLIIGLFIMLFATIGSGTPVWLIVVEVFCYGFFTSLQYTSMNTLVYADVGVQQESAASSIASTMQQMAISFGVATASLVTAFFVPDRHTSGAAEFIHGIHRAFFVLGGMTLVSTAVFYQLKKGDGDTVSQRKAVHEAIGFAESAPFAS